MTAETSVPSTALLTGADRDGSNYTARHLLVLEGLEAVRKRPGMYIGSTDSRGLMHCLWEIIDNSVDEALGGYCDHIEVILHDDGSVEVRDNGRGIPVDVEPKTGLSGVEVVMTKLHAGGKFGGGSYAASGGLHGVGASVVNALSARLDVEVDRGGAHPRHQLPPRRARRLHRARARRRVRPGGRPAQGQARSPRPAPAPACGTGPTGRSSSRTPSSPWSTLHQRARQTAFLVPGLTIVVRDECGLGEGGSKGEESFRFDGGISEFCEYLATDKPVCDVLPLHRAGHLQGDRAGPGRPRPDDADRGHPRAGRGRRAALGHRDTTRR